jgi:hypothetical protein
VNAGFALQAVGLWFHKCAKIDKNEEKVGKV